MSSPYVFAIEGLEDLGNIEDLKPEIVRAAYRAINAASDRARVLSSKEIRKQVNFPAAYLQGDKSRLKVTQRASANSLEGIITGRQRPTSLARFASGNLKGGERGNIRVQVKPGSSVNLARAFMMKLKAGAGAIDTAHNLGLAIRVPKGQKPDKAYKPMKVAEGIYLLYGPSVDQVFKQVRGEVSAEVSDYLATEFNRLLEVKL